MAQPDTSPGRMIGETKSIFAITLPFKRQDVSREHFDRAICQTRKRWAWFTESRELDATFGTELGTLGYLPWEIRRQIFEAVLGRLYRLVKRMHRAWWPFYQGYSSEPGIMCYKSGKLLQPGSQLFDVGDPFDLTSYILGYVSIEDPTRNGYALNAQPTPISLRLSSPTLKNEFDDVFFSDTIFKFKSCAEFQQFLLPLSDFQRTKLRRIIIRIWIHCDCFDRFDRLPINWKDTSWLQLPASLQQVSFELDYKPEEAHLRHCSLEVNGRLSKAIKALAGIVEVLRKVIVRSAPGAVLKMHARKDLPPEHAELFDAALNDVER